MDSVISEIVTEQKITRNPYQQHISCLLWKSYLQRQRRWRLLVLETVVAAVLFMASIYLALPVFLTPLQDQPEKPLKSTDILNSFGKDTVVGFAPNKKPYLDVMREAAELLKTTFLLGNTIEDLNVNLAQVNSTVKGQTHVIWVLFAENEENTWKYTIRNSKMLMEYNSHLKTGSLAVQLAVDSAIVEYVSRKKLDYKLDLVAMPVSPLMDVNSVRGVMSLLLMCYTIALLPPVMETEALVVTETISHFKRSLFMRDVTYSSIYIGWLFYGLFTAFPIYILGSITLILIFRWIHLFSALMTLVAYGNVMMMMGMIMAMFHIDPLISCVWSTMTTLLQTFLAELLVHHNYYEEHQVLTFTLHMLLPPLGLIHGFNQFALLQTGPTDSDQTQFISANYTILSWIFMITIYFVILMLLQRTIGRSKAIGGQVSWKSIVFKQAEDREKLRRIRNLTGHERDKLQQVDEFVPKAISFRNVTKHIMGECILRRMTFDIYRNEYSVLYAQRIQERMLQTIEDLLTGLTLPDYGNINILGEFLTKDVNLMTECYMTGYCHSSTFLIADLTVEEHLNMYADICMWKKSTDQKFEYTQIRIFYLLRENDLLKVRRTQIQQLDSYYKAQLCWAIATLMEPKVVILPSHVDGPIFKAVIKDKIMQFKRFITIVKFTYSSISLEYADRSFLFDSSVLHFGGTPGYMFFKYGREYRIRITLSSISYHDSRTEKLLERAEKAGAAVRAHLGALLILRMPTTPTDLVASLIQDLHNGYKNFGITSINITLPDSEEVCNRAMFRSQSEAIHTSSSPSSAENEKAIAALKKITEAKDWKREQGFLKTQINVRLFKGTAWKFFSFYIHYRIIFIITMVITITAGIAIGLSLERLMTLVANIHESKHNLTRENILTVEALVGLKRKTTIVIGIDSSDEAKSIGTSYAMSSGNKMAKDVKHMSYTAVARPDRLKEFLIHRAIDSPQEYVYMYAYGLDIQHNKQLRLQVLYSPIHKDIAAAARSLSRTYMALLRHFSGLRDASIEITDNPLQLGQTIAMRQASAPPFWIQFLLILTISHITLIPSKERGLMRYIQTHAANSSPIKYWFTLYLCDLILYWLLVAVMSIVMVCVLVFTNMSYFYWNDIIAIPFMLIIYGLGCIPMAYCFSLGPNDALNTMAFIMFNVVFGETTIVSRILNEDLYNYTLNLLSVNPQFNMASALVKIRQTYLHNSECRVYAIKNLCSTTSLHRCCERCGIISECFTRQYYLIGAHGILIEVTGTLYTAALFMSGLLIYEYKIPQRLWKFAVTRVVHWRYSPDDLTPGNLRERDQVFQKELEITSKSKTRTPFGEYLLVCDVGRKTKRKYFVRHVNFGLGKGEILALSGLKRHGRLKLCRLLAGFRLPHQGNIWCMSKYRLTASPLNYGRNVSFCCDDELVPSWMTVYDSLEMIGTIRGIPEAELKVQLNDYIDALELTEVADLLICRLRFQERKRLNFLVAVIGAPPILVLDEYTANQSDTVRRAMYSILHRMKQLGHSIIVGSTNMEGILPVTNRLAIITDGHLYDIGNLDTLLERYSDKGCTVVVHLKDEVDIEKMFQKYFKHFVINDTMDVLVNVQVLDEIDVAAIFEKMEKLKTENTVVYSYIISYVPIDYVYNHILSVEKGLKESSTLFTCPLLRELFTSSSQVTVSNEVMQNLIPFKKKYNICKLTELPWSVIFQR